MSLRMRPGNLTNDLLRTNTTACGTFFAIAAVLLFFAVPAPRCHGGLGWRDGSERGLWDTDGYAVVVGIISDIVPNHYGCSARLELRASLCGKIDPSLVPELKVSFDDSGATTSIQERPQEGACVIAVVCRQNGDQIVPDVCAFMPGRSSLVTIQGLDDPKVTETLKRLQAARKRAEANGSATMPKISAATQP